MCYVHLNITTTCTSDTVQWLAQSILLLCRDDYMIEVTELAQLETDHTRGHLTFCTASKLLQSMYRYTCMSLATHTVNTKKKIIISLSKPLTHFDSSPECNGMVWILEQCSQCVHHLLENQLTVAYITAWVLLQPVLNPDTWMMMKL